MLDKFTIAAKVLEKFDKKASKTRINHTKEIEKIWNAQGSSKEKSAAAADYIKKVVDQIQIPEDLKIDLAKYLLEYSKLIEHFHDCDYDTAS